MTEPMPEAWVEKALTAYAAADVNRLNLSPWDDPRKNVRALYGARMEAALTAVEQDIRADERAKALAPIRALCDADDARPDAFMHGTLSTRKVRAAIAQTEDPS